MSTRTAIALAIAVTIALTASVTATVTMALRPAPTPAPQVVSAAPPVQAAEPTQEAPGVPFSPPTYTPQPTYTPLPTHTPYRPPPPATPTAYPTPVAIAPPTLPPPASTPTPATAVPPTRSVARSEPPTEVPSAIVEITGAYSLNDNEIQVDFIVKGGALDDSVVLKMEIPGRWSAQFINFQRWPGEHTFIATDASLDEQVNRAITLAFDDFKYDHGHWRKVLTLHRFVHEPPE